MNRLDLVLAELQPHARGVEPEIDVAHARVQQLDHLRSGAAEVGAF